MLYIEALKQRWSDRKSAQEAKRAQKLAVQGQKKARPPSATEVWLRGVVVALGSLGIALLVGSVCALAVGVGMYMLLQSQVFAVGFAAIGLAMAGGITWILREG